MAMQRRKPSGSGENIAAHSIRYRDIYLRSPAAYLILNADGLILDANLSAMQLLKTDSTAILRQSFKRFVAPASRNHFLQHYRKLFEESKNQDVELQLIRGNDQVFYASVSCVVLLDEGNDDLHGLLFITDIDARKKTDDELQKKEKRYRHIVEDQTELICRYLPDGTLTFVNEAYCRFFNRRKDQLVGSSFFELIPENDHEQICRMIASLDGRHPSTKHQHRVVLPDGRIGWQEWTNRIIYNKKGVLVEYQAAGRDITDLKEAEAALQKAHDQLEILVEKRTAELRQESRRLLEEIAQRRQTEQALRSSEERFRSIFDHIGVGIALISPEMRILAMNPQMRTWFPDVDPDTNPLCYRSFNNPPRDSVCSYCPTFGAIQDGQVHEAVADTPRINEIRHYRIIASPLKDQEGRIMAAIEMVTDITEGVRTRQQLLESDVRYRTVFENTGTAMLILNEDMSIAYVNREFEKISGVQKNEIIGRREWTDFIMPEDLKRMMKYHRLRRRNPEAAPSSYECRAQDRKGRVLDLFLNVALIPGTSMSVVSMMDISERKRAMESLKKREHDLAVESHRLQEMNTALKILLQQREEDRQEMEMKVLSNIRKLVLPYVEKLMLTSMNPVQAGYLDVISGNLNNVISPFLRSLTAAHMDFTPREIEVANLVREGKAAKDIAGLLNLSVRSVEFHKDNIRKKLGLNNKKVNLRTHLMTLS
jgi:PAS domain S-box-containing protein